MHGAGEAGGYARNEAQPCRSAGEARVSASAVHGEPAKPAVAHATGPGRPEPARRALSRTIADAVSLTPIVDGPAFTEAADPDDLPAQDVWRDALLDNVPLFALAILLLLLAVLATWQARP